MRRALVAAAAVLLLLAPAAGTRAAAAGAVPVPENDPFYAVPSNIASYADGAILASRRITATVLNLPVPAEAWQVKYRTTARGDQPTATVTTLLVPSIPWAGPGPRPLLSYQTAEDGVAGHCAPSYAFRAGILGDAGLVGGLTGSYTETGLVGLALLQGWAVSVPDYEGPRSEFLVADVAGHGVLDGIRAARRFQPAGISAKARIGLWGYSGGSQASMAAAQLQPTYAPELHLSGLAVGGLLVNVRESIRMFDGTAFGGAIPMGVNGFLRAYPDVHIERYLNDYGRGLVKEESADCIFQAVPRHPFLSSAAMESVAHAFDQPAIMAMFRQNSPLFMRGVPRTPVYGYHSVLDELAPIAQARRQIRRYCAAGLRVSWNETLVGEHLLQAGAGAGGAISWLASRFAGTPAPSNCDSVPR